ncbi:MAG: S9 family peptidase [Bacteroidota bacterium]|nr:S9 family peptidase [Bacteroidota bacterium]
MYKKIFAALLLFISVNSFAQKKQVTLEDIWKNYSFFPGMFGGFNSMKDGISYSQMEENGDINKYEFKSGKLLSNVVKATELIPEGSKTAITPGDYYFSDDESKIVFPMDQEGIYRRSATATNYVFDLKTRKLKSLSEKGKQMFATIAPVGNKVAFVRDNNLFVRDLDNNSETQLTNDGDYNKIKNGWADWVYEEEFSKAEAFTWNATGTKVAYIKFDESKVKEYEMTMYDGLYPSQYKFKYPKTGEGNSIVSVHIYDLASAKTTTVDIGKETDIYIPRIIWTTDANTLSVQRMNRLQNKVELLFANATDGSTKVILTEEAKTYIDIADNLRFLSANKGFIWSSEMDGYNHLYYYDINGKLINQITKGNWDVMDFKGFDEKSKILYYVSTEVSATDRDLYSVSLDGKKKTKLSTKKGTTDASFSASFKFYVSTWSDANTPYVSELHSADGKLIKVLEENKEFNEKLKTWDFTKKEFFTFKTSENVELNGWMMKPTSFDATKKYPVYMFAYGGPGSNECNNQWEIYDYAWHQLLCQQGYIVVCVDGRGTLGRGRDFKHSTYMQLGKLETIDQIEVAKYLGNQTYVDKTRIGFQGWSFGGYLASLLITKGADYFKSTIAVAPVTNWRYYDNIYTERFLRTPQENPKGYDENSPINFTKDIKGKFMLIHGSADDNVHLQNSMEMTKELVKNNIPFEQFIYPNKNHGIYGGNTRLHLYTKMLKFVKENL